jgi:hypothetical protein
MYFFRSGKAQGSIFEFKPMAARWNPQWQSRGRSSDYRPLIHRKAFDNDRRRQGIAPHILWVKGHQTLASREPQAAIGSLASGGLKST